MAQERVKIEYIELDVSNISKTLRLKKLCCLVTTNSTRTSMQYLNAGVRAISFCAG